jgi:hypothetical protein
MADVPVNFTGKVCGVNLTSKPTHPKESAYWIEWDWAGWIRKQIDYSMAMGANAIRLIGDVAMVLNSQLSQATYNTRLAQFVAYCADNNLSIYYTGCANYDTNGADNGNIAAYNANAQGFADVIKSQIAYICGGAGGDYTTSILGVDIFQEANAWNNATGVNNLYSLIKSFVPASIGCTFSTSNPTSTAWLTSIIGSCDYIDWHVYPQVLGIGNETTTAQVTAGPRTTYPDKDIIFGEGGADRGAWSAIQVENWYAGLSTLGMMSDSKVRGAMMWATTDQDDLYGAFDSTWTPRTEILLPWVKGSATSASPLAPPPPYMLDNGLVIVNPRGTSTDYAGVKIYRDGELIASPVAGIFDDSADFVLGDVYTAKITTASNGDSAMSEPYYTVAPQNVLCSGSSKKLPPRYLSVMSG